MIGQRISHDLGEVTCVCVWCVRVRAVTRDGKRLRGGGDVTLQYRTATPFHGGNQYSSVTAGTTNYIQNNINGEVSSTVVMGNAYWDLTHYNGLTPFIGAGIGAAYNHTGNTRSMSAGSFLPQYGQYTDKGTWNLAWALHSGVSWDVNSRLKLEAGYSFTSLGSAKSHLTTCYGSTGSVACNEDLTLKNLYSHDLHLGMRWLLDGGATTTAYRETGQSYRTYQPGSYADQSTSYRTVDPGSYRPVTAKN